jgi:hypothetical protein
LPGQLAKLENKSIKQPAAIKQMASKQPKGDIVTLLDLTTRDVQDGELFPLSHTKTWWLPDPERRVRPFTLSVQQFPIRGPTAFGQRFTFDLGSVKCGDVLQATVLQVGLGHWFDDTTLLRFASTRNSYPSSANPYYYASSLGSVILQQAELEIDGQTIETIDGDFINVFSLLFQDVNTQYGFSADGLGRTPFTELGNTPSTNQFPTQNGTIFIPLSFFYQRTRLAEAFPLLACREGTVRIHITFRPFHEVVRRLQGTRSSCEEVPLNQTIPILTVLDGQITVPSSVQTSVAIPGFKNIQLVTYAAHTDGEIRQKILRSPFEILVRNLQTFTFDEPLKYQVTASSKDTITVQLPIEVNHPMEEIIWFVRRKDVNNNNEWVNYSSVLQPEYDPIFNPRKPLLLSARIQLNGIDLIFESEEWYRQHISLLHKGGIAAYENYIYGYSFAKHPGQHQPSGTANASRLQSVRLTLDVKAEHQWEVKVFVLACQWIRFQNGMANKMFTD